MRGLEQHKLMNTKTLLSTRGSCCLDDDREVSEIELLKKVDFRLLSTVYAVRL